MRDQQNEDMELAAVFTRRDPATVDLDRRSSNVQVEDVEAWKDKIDVMILCGGSAQIFRNRHRNMQSFQCDRQL